MSGVKINSLIGNFKTNSNGKKLKFQKSSADYTFYNNEFDKCQFSSVNLEHLVLSVIRQ